MGIQTPEVIFPLRDGTKWCVPSSVLFPLEQAYGQERVWQELHYANAWLETNPTRRKTQRGMPRFLNGWMARAKYNPRPNALLGVYQGSNEWDEAEVAELRARMKQQPPEAG